MSIELLSQVFRLEMRPHGKKWVLACFADAANPDGVTWIALESERGRQDMITKTCMSLRAIRAHVAELEAEGYLERIEKPGKGCLWIVRPCPANSAGLFDGSPADFSNRPANSAGEPLLTVIEERKAERLGPPVDKCPITSIVLPPGLSLEQWEAFLDMRFALGKAMKPYVAGILLKKLTDIGKRWVAGDVVDRSTVNGWPDLYEPEEGKVTGVRRVAGGCIAEPVGGLSEEDRLELARIDALMGDDPVAARAARKHYFERQDARNTPTQIGRLVGELPLLALANRRKKKG